MPNLAAILKSEIQRLARRSVRPLYVPLKKDVAALKHTAAAQKRTIAQLLRQNAQLMADLNSRLAVPSLASKEDVAHSRIGPKVILARRHRLGLSRVQFGQLLGVSAGAILNWEGGRSKPRAAAKAALVAIKEIGKREALQRLEALNPRTHSKVSGTKRAANGRGSRTRR